MKFDPAGALYSLIYMGKGLFGIFVVIGVIYALIVILNAMPAVKKFFVSIFRSIFKKKKAHAQ